MSKFRNKKDPLTKSCLLPRCNKIIHSFLREKLLSPLNRFKKVGKNPINHYATLPLPHTFLWKTYQPNSVEFYPTLEFFLGNSGISANIE